MESEFENITCQSPPGYPIISHDNRIIVGGVYLVITVAGILGNLIVIFAVFASKKLQTFTNMFVVNLSVADLMACLMMQLQCVMMFSPDCEYPFGKLNCAVVATLLCTACGCSLYTLASIAFYRLVLLTDNTRTRADKLQTLPCAIIWISITWIIPLLVNVLTHVFASEKFGYNSKYHVCGAEDQDINRRDHEIEIAQVFGLYTVAFIFITLSYGYIFYYVHKHTRETLRELDRDYETKSNKNNNWKSVSIRSWRRNGSTSSTQSENARQLFRRQLTITRNMFYVVLAFIICITPYSLCLIFPSWNGLLYSGALLMFNSTVNPVLYGFKHPHFRQVFRCLFTCRWSDVPKPSESFKTICKLLLCSKNWSKYELRQTATTK